MNSASQTRPRRIVVRRSGIHGKGVFATTEIAADTRLIEYKGIRMSSKACDDMYGDESTHTFLFMLDDGNVIDGGRHGNAARWINHSCSPNCEADEEDGRVYSGTLCDIMPGEEITIDYNLFLEERYTPAVKKAYACLCGSPDCRGTMLGKKR